MFKLLNKVLSQRLYPSYHERLLPKVSNETAELQWLLEAPIKKGWYVVECQTKEPCILNLNFLCGGSTFELSIKNSGVAKRIIFVQKKTDVIRITLKAVSNSNRIQCLRFVKVRHPFAVKRMLKRLDVAEEQIQQKFIHGRCTFDSFLFGVYDQLFSTDKEVQYQSWILWVEPRYFEHSVDDRYSESEFLLFCAPGYQLAPKARGIMAFLLKQHPYAKLVYVDEDTIDAMGQRSLPIFKADWNPDLFLSSDYVSSCYLCRRSWYLEKENLFEQYGANLALTSAFLELQSEEVIHTPQILVHRQVELQMPGLKKESQREGILKELMPLLAEVKPMTMSGMVTYRLKYALPEPEPLVSLIIPMRDSLELTKACIQSLLGKTIYSHYEILILDNQSRQPETLQWFLEIQQHPQVTVIQYNHPFNYSAINNFGVKHANGSIIGLINNDIEVISPDWLTEMVSHACRPEIGCVGAKLYYSDGRIQHAGVILSSHNVAMHGHRFFDGDADGYQGRLKLVQNYSAVTGACLVVRKEIYEQVGGLNEEHLAVAYNDVDFCLKVREVGYRNLWTPYAELYHHESMSRGNDDTPKKRKRLKKEAAYMRKRWGKELANDPCYNPNLTSLKEDFSLRVI